MTGSCGASEELCYFCTNTKRGLFLQEGKGGGGRERGEGQDRNPRFFQIAHKDFGKMFQVADSPVCGGDQLSLLEAPRSLCFCSPSAPFIKWEDDVACGAEGVLVGWREVEEVGG